MIIAATSDILAPRYYGEFISALDKLQVQPDIFLIAGDMVYRADVDEFEKVSNALFGKIQCPIVACFGNNEFQEIREQVKQKYRNIRFLDDQSIVIDVGRESIGVFGSTGALDTPTSWQRTNVPNIENIFKMRYDMADKHLHRMHATFRILMTHYAPTHKTLEGENPRFHASLGAKYWENLITTLKPNLVLHGHNHHGLKMSWVDSVPVMNVALPLNREIVVVDTQKIKPGLAQFV